MSSFSNPRLAVCGAVCGALVATQAQSADLLISQYYQGTGNNRWLELTNVSSTWVDLSTYRLGCWKDSNAEGYKSNSPPTAGMALSGLLAPGATYLIRDSSAVLPSYPMAQAQAGSGSVMDFTGNDSLALYTDGTFVTSHVVDAIGFTNAGAEGVGTSFVRQSTGAGWSTTAGSRVTDFPAVWKAYTPSSVNSAANTAQNRLGVASPTPLPNIAGSWQLQFQDDFDGSSLDGTKWRLGQHWAGIAGSGGLSPSNVSVSSGKLTLRAEQRAMSFSGVNYGYATGEISTFFNYRQQYGYFEARVKYPAVNGLWPAFWMMPDRGAYGSQNEYSRAYLKFDLTQSGITSVSSAVLKLKVAARESGGTNNLVFMKLQDDAWSESTLTWNNKPTPNPVWMAQQWNNDVSAGDEISVDVTSYVAQQITGDKKVSLVVADTFLRTKYLHFHSREAAAAADRPQLVINGVAYVATEDATVQWGDQAGINQGSSAVLKVEDGWGDTASTYNGGMEVDIMESLGIWGASKTSHATHWNGYGSDHLSKGWGPVSYPSLPDGFHVYGAYWQQGLLAFYVDGVKTGEWSDSRILSVPAYMLLSLQLGGWDSNTPGSQVNGQQMQVDWVRTWSGTRASAGAASELIVDNAGSGAVAVGEWPTSSYTSGYQGTNYAHDNNADKGRKAFRFKPALGANGVYQVYARWTEDANRATAVPIDVVTAGGSVVTVKVNQRTGSGQWNLLGTFPLSTTQAEVIVRTDGTTDGYVVADAVRLVPVTP
ncbi:golvesin C-terminal-like domain-containing protein [Hyalangium versicolor]|uniref:golvesin C-terminal-like domain-containing protein n=1 Tax=Hyalangium versicolor TaxID=2861190 RepID=UPI001CCE3A4C|nr:DNRLRE domain-containing protein [Hyalangium versicolor]